MFLTTARTTFVSSLHGGRSRQRFAEESARDWRSFIVPSEIGLKHEGDRLYTTRGGKRVYVTTAREEPDGEWSFDAKPKSYEVIVLLCWSKTFELSDYVVPQSVYVKPWTVLKKSHGKTEFTLR